MWKFSGKLGQTEDDNRKTELFWFVVILIVLFVIYLVMNADAGPEVFSEEPDWYH